MFWSFGHCLHLIIWSVSAYIPTAHFLQVFKPNWPVLQTEHVDEIVVGVHCLHALLDVTTVSVVYVLGGHDLHVAWFGLSWYVPVLHGLHFVVFTPLNIRLM